MNLIERYGRYSTIFVIGCMLERSRYFSRLNGAMTGIIAAVGFVASKTFIEQYATNAQLISWPLSLSVSVGLTYKILQQFQLFRDPQPKTEEEKTTAFTEMLAKLLTGAGVAGIVCLVANSRLFTIASK